MTWGRCMDDVKDMKRHRATLLTCAGTQGYSYYGFVKSMMASFGKKGIGMHGHQGNTPQDAAWMPATAGIEARSGGFPCAATIKGHAQA